MRVIFSAIVGFALVGCAGSGRVLMIKSEPADSEICIKGKARSHYFSNAKSCVGTTPFEDDQVEITERDGGKRTVKFKDVEGDKEGFYVVVSHAGYLSQAVEVPKWEHLVQLKPEGAHPNIAAPAPSVPVSLAVPAVAEKPAEKGSVKISSDPVGALVYFNDALKGNTPFTYEGADGPVKMRLEMEGYAPLEKTLTIEPGHIINVNFKMLRAPIKN
jgi:hypothetical protein